MALTEGPVLIQAGVDQTGLAFKRTGLFVSGPRTRGTEEEDCAAAWQSCVPKQSKAKQGKAKRHQPGRRAGPPPLPQTPDK